jgi:hypothetical protein
MAESVTASPPCGYNPPASPILSESPVCNNATVVTGGLRTPRETAAFNAGVSTALSAARRSADAIEKLPTFKEGRQGFASAALKAFAEAGTALLLGEPDGAPEPPKEASR